MSYGRNNSICNKVWLSYNKNLCQDKSGGLEGMPLQLLIIVVVAVMALGLIMSWVSSIDEPPKSIKVIDVKIDGSHEDIDLSRGSPGEIRIMVYDQELKKIDGAVVTLEGCGYDEISASTGSGTFDPGTVVFDGGNVELPSGIRTGEIRVTVKKASYATKTTSILVYYS